MLPQASALKHASHFWTASSEPAHASATATCASSRFLAALLLLALATLYSFFYSAGPSSALRFLPHSAEGASLSLRSRVPGGFSQPGTDPSSEERNRALGVVVEGLEGVVGGADAASSSSTPLHAALVGQLAQLSRELARQRDILFVSLASEEHMRAWALPLLVNILHALRHGHPFLIHSHLSAPVPLSNPYFHKILAVQEALLHHHSAYSAVVYLDADTLIMAPPQHDIFHRLLFNTSELESAQVGLADQSNNLNAGVILLRNTPWTREFVARWWAAAEAHPRAQFGDQGALYLLILEQLLEVRPGAAEAKTCEAWQPCLEEEDRLETELHFCLTDQLNCRGFEYGRRMGIGNVSVLPAHVPEYRINQWYFEHKEHDEWYPADYYHPGDPVAHTKAHTHILNPLHFRLLVRSTFDALRHRCDLPLSPPGPP